MKQYAVIGLGRFGSSVAIALAEKGQQVLAIDSNEELVHDVMENVTKAVCLDAVDEKAARAVGLQNVDVAVCGVGTNVESSILITLLLKDLGIPVIICKATSNAHKKVLEKVGATKVILPEKDTGERVAETLVSLSDTVLDRIGLAGGASIIEFVPPKEFIGKSLRELDMRVSYGVNVIAMKKKAEKTPSGEALEEDNINVTPQADDIIGKKDILIIFGENERIEEIRDRFRSSLTDKEK
ncbi:MAG: TrkA family potassium uptake protein [Candidatus Omnitrophota bacterium]